MPPRVIGTVLDITDRIQAEKDLAYQGLHDALTGFANRTLFLDRLELTLCQAERGTNPIAVLLLDIDDFKAVNDALGHSAGDQLLGDLAQRLALVTRGRRYHRPPRRRRVRGAPRLRCHAANRGGHRGKDRQSAHVAISHCRHRRDRERQHRHRRRATVPSCLGRLAPRRRPSDVPRQAARKRALRDGSPAYARRSHPSPRRGHGSSQCPSRRRTRGLLPGHRHRSPTRRPPAPKH